jgi:hypothetical protein
VWTFNGEVLGKAQKEDAGLLVRDRRRDEGDDRGDRGGRGGRGRDRNDRSGGRES